MWKTALPCLCLLLFSQLHAGASSSPEPQYMLLVPTVLHGEHMEKVCLLLTHLNESITLSIILECKDSNVTIAKDVVAENELDQCWEFKLPKIASEVAYVTLVGKGPTMEFHGKRSVLLQPSENLVFVQTDKPIYKPGQTVLFRVVALNEDFHSVNETFPLIFIENPQRNRVNQWRDVKTDGGIAQLSFPLASEPLHGTYKVCVERSRGARVEHSFGLEEYVLPKFEVIVTMPKALTILDKEVKVTVCARYTYGKPVPGVLNVSVCRKFRQSYRYSSCKERDSEAVCEDFSRTADARGCFHEVVPTKIFQMKRSGYEDTLKVTAKMVEEGTGVELTGEGSSDISSTIGRAIFQHVDTYFKKGLPIHGQVRLEDSTGAPIANETVFIFVGHDNTNFSYTTDQEGKAAFSIDSSPYGALSLQLRASYKTAEHCGSSNWVTPSYSDGHHTVRYSYSKSGSYVKMQPIYNTLNPGHEEQVTVHYVLSSVGLGDAEEVVFHHVLVCWGRGEAS